MKEHAYLVAGKHTASEARLFYFQTLSLIRCSLVAFGILIETHEMQRPLDTVTPVVIEPEQEP